MVDVVYDVHVRGNRGCNRYLYDRLAGILTEF
jgi:hypothetical protein